MPKMYNKKNARLFGYILLIIMIGMTVSAFSDGDSPVTKTSSNDYLEDTLALHFKDPPPAYSMLPFWSLNNTLDTNKLNWQMDQMLDKGVYGAFMHAREGLDQSATPYFSDGWWNAIESTVKNAHKKGFYTYLYDEDKWPSGSAGGRTIKANPERNIKKILRYTNFEMLGNQTVKVNFVTNPFAIFAGKISDRGVYDFSTQIDLTALSGKEWKAPAGRWAIIAFTLIKDPEQQINYMDSATVADFLHITHDEYYRRLGPYFGNTIPGVFFDEIYVNSRDRRNNIFWSDDFEKQFKQMKGYELKPYLPLIIFNDPKLSSAKRYDYFDAVKDIYGKAWFVQYAKWADDHHIWVTGHTTEELIQYIRQSDYFFTQGQLQVPCTDNEDFRYGHPREIDWYNPKQISSIGHMYGRQRMSAESMGGGGYTIPLDEYRYGFAMMGVYGVNMFVPHLFHYSMDRPENQADWPPSWFFQNPYWKYFKPLANYAARVSYMIAQGKHVCNVAVAVPLTQTWLGGYNTPVEDDHYKEVQRTLLNNHIDYDIIDPYSLSKASINNRKLQVANEEYQVLILPSLKAIQTDCMAAINKFIANGGIVIGLNELPQASEKGTPVDPFIVESMTDIFGFEPRELGQQQYHSQDKERSNHTIIKENSAGGKGIFSRYIEELPGIISHQLVADVTIEGAENNWLQCQHRSVGDKEVYFFVNGRKQSGSFTVSLQNVGRPFLWNTETGNIKPVTNYRMNNGRLELVLDFKPWESFFIVLEPGNPVKNNVLIQSSDLDQAEILHDSNGEVISGWSTGAGNHTVSFLNGNDPITQKWQGKSSLPEIPVSGNWEFQFCPKALNEKWSADVNTDTVELPVMQFKSAYNQEWKQIKVDDPFSKVKGCARYLTDWDADWISYYDNSMHLPEMGGGSVWFKKQFAINGIVKSAFIDITADETYELYLNGRLVGKDNNWKNAGHYAVMDFLLNGSNELLVKTSNTKALLLQGSVELMNGRKLTLKTDDSWKASKDEVIWLPALQYASPPLGTWGNIERPGHTIQFPCNAVYRQLLPPGTEAIIEPSIKAQYDVFVNDQSVKFNGQVSASIKKLLRADKNMLTVKVRLKDYNEGLQQPIQLICGKTPVALGLWKDMGMDWYSGRALYTHAVQIRKEYCEAGKRMVIDLGEVDHFAEIWINNQLVEYRSWAPFRADITKYIHPGENKISIVVANLLANQATWNMLDANIDNKDARWWHFGSMMREKEKLASGLLGPVRLIPYVKDSVQLMDRNK